MGFAKKRRPKGPIDNGLEPYTYQTYPCFLTAAENSFYRVLIQALGEDAVVFPKVRIADVLKPTQGLSRGDWQRAFNRISSKHFDYIVCAPDTLNTICVIELDDASHKKESRLERDEFINDACESAGLILHRIPAKSNYQLDAIREQILSASFPTRIKPDDNSPLCPKCKAPLVERIASKGKQKGKSFMGCSEFPRCRYVSRD